MIKVAQQRSLGFSNIDYLVANALTWDYLPDQFDCIVSIAAFHHLPIGEILRLLKKSLRPGGILVVLDLFKGEGIKELLIGVIATPTHLILRLIKIGRLREPVEVRKAWAEHRKIDHYLPLSEVRSVCKLELPGAIVKRHLLWRYSIVWKKPVDGE
jgi:SAM-dependent methyltransferase